MRRLMRIPTRIPTRRPKTRPTIRQKKREDKETEFISYLQFCKMEVYSEIISSARDIK